jgi:hypothetical protein
MLTPTHRREIDAQLAGIFQRTVRCCGSLFASGELERELRESLLTAEAVVGRVLQRWYRKIEAVENPTLRQRADDVLDLGRNMIRRLRGEQGAELQSVPEGSILVAQHLLPSDLVLIPRSRVAAVVVETLGQGSHAALARGDPNSRASGHPVPHRQRTELRQTASGHDMVARKRIGTKFQGRFASGGGTRALPGPRHQPARTLDGQRITSRRMWASPGIWSSLSTTAHRRDRAAQIEQL